MNKQKIKKLVYIIESPSSNDFYNKRLEGQALISTLKLIGIYNRHIYATDKKNFMKALSTLKFESILKRGKFPILHISAHGNDDGISLTNKEVVNWNEFRDLLIPINELLKRRLIICMSSCRGWSACKTAMAIGKVPYLVLLGSKEDLTFSEGIIGFATFYHQIENSKSTLEEIVEIMKKAAVHAHFDISSGKEIRDKFISAYIDKFCERHTT